MRIGDNDAERKASRRLELVSCTTARTRLLTDIPDDTMIEILLRLPIRTIVSLRSVCSSCRNLISAPDFTWNYLRRFTTPRIAYCTWGYSNDVTYGSIGLLPVHSILDNPSEPTQVDCFREQRYYEIVGSCNGLLCLIHESDYHRYMHAILWNPCTGFNFESPEISGDVRFCGFGYDCLSDSYKIYATIRKAVASDYECSSRIYTFGPTSSWRKIDDIPLALFGVSSDNYGLAINREGVYFGSSRLCTINWGVNYVVVYFDLSKETYGHFPLPGSEIDLGHYFPRRCTHLCVLRNCLSVCYEHKRTRDWITHKWTVWQMKEYGDAQSWTKLAVIPLHKIFTYSNPCRCLQPLYISESDVLLVFCPFFGIVLCNLNDGSVDFPKIDSSGMGNHPAFSQCDGYRMACIYHESLIQPNGLRSNSSKMLRFIKPKPKPMDS